MNRYTVTLLIDEINAITNYCVYTVQVVDNTDNTRILSRTFKDSYRACAIYAALQNLNPPRKRK